VLIALCHAVILGERAPRIYGVSLRN
jgi:hypothetical protein